MHSATVSSTANREKGKGCSALRTGGGVCFSRPSMQPIPVRYYTVSCLRCVASRTNKCGGAIFWRYVRSQEHSGAKKWAAASPGIRSFFPPIMGRRPTSCCALGCLRVAHTTFAGSCVASARDLPEDMPEDLRNHEDLTPNGPGKMKKVGPSVHFTLHSGIF